MDTTSWSADGLQHVIMELMADSQDENYGYQFCLVQIDDKDYPQLSRPIRHELPNFSFWSHTLLYCFSTHR